MSLTVMIVDDSLIMAQKLKMMFGELGHEVVQICKDGEEAIRAYPVVKPDLVTMDITMPGVGGVEATRAIKAAHADARVILVTSHGQEAMVLRAIEAGASGYVLKPVARDKLAATANRATANTGHR
jgi:two-component system chemotaxis response regulator CheY